MASNKLSKISEDEEKSSFFSSIGFKEISKPVPDSYKVGRDAQLQLSKVERNLFTDMEEKESGNYIISGLGRKVSELDFTAFSFAVGQLLYNQSYLSGNLDTNSGISKKKAKIGKNTDQFSGEIVTSLSDICRLAYGVDKPDFRQKTTMSTLIDTLHKTTAKIRYPNGDELESHLCLTMNKYTREKDGAVLYDLFINPIFCSRVAENFSELPQDIIVRLSKATKRKTEAHYLLIRLLSLQVKGRIFIRTIDVLLKELNLEAAYKEQRARTEKQLLSIFATMVKIKIIDNFDLEYTTVKTKKILSKVTFHLSTRAKLIGNNEQDNE